MLAGEMPQSRSIALPRHQKEERRKAEEQIKTKETLHMKPLMHKQKRTATEEQDTATQLQLPA